jgi:hypothetical protein
MLQESKLAAGAEDTPQLAEGALRIGDGAKHQRRDGHIEGPVQKRKLLGAIRQKFDLSPEAVSPRLRSPKHIRIRLNPNNLRL